jgi:hypothetical protein
MRKATMTHRPHLSPARQELVVLVARLRYGCIENIIMHRGEPDLSRIRVLQDVKLGRLEGSPAQPCDDATEKMQYRHLWEVLDDVRDGYVVRLEVQDGLPFRVRVYGAPAKLRAS